MPDRVRRVLRLHESYIQFAHDHDLFVQELNRISVKRNMESIHFMSTSFGCIVGDDDSDDSQVDCLLIIGEVPQQICFLPVRFSNRSFYHRFFFRSVYQISPQLLMRLSL